MEKLTLYDERALLGTARSPLRPGEPASVAACFDDPGLSLRLVAEKRIKAYAAWLWEGNDGQAYYSKKLANGRTFAWRPGATVQRVLAASPSMRAAAEAKKVRDAAQQEKKNVR